MKSFTSLYLALLFLITLKANAGTDKTTLSGRITSKTGDTLVGATVYIPDLKTGAVTGIDGTFKIENLPQAKVLVDVRALGYKTIVAVVDLQTTISKDFVMESSIEEIEEIVVTGTSKA